MRQKMLFLARIAVYLLAFVVPPVLVGVVGVKAVLSDRYEGPPDSARVYYGDLPAPPRHDPAVRSWAQENGLEPEFVHVDAPAGSSAGFPFDATLSDLAEHENAPVASFMARLLEYPTDHLGLAGDGWPFARLLRPLAVGLLGLALAVLVDRFLLAPWKKRLHLGHGSTGALSSAPAKDRR